MADSNRTMALRKARSDYDNGIGFEAALAHAYDAGHRHGCGVAHLTEAEKDLANAVRELGEYQVQTLAIHVDASLALIIDSIRNEGKEDEPDSERTQRADHDYDVQKDDKWCHGHD